jgi:hypothetical protein
VRLLNLGLGLLHLALRLLRTLVGLRRLPPKDPVGNLAR